jgi:EmrB/QacA subfamily drug resistance transporter
MISMSMVAFEATIVATAMPKIAGDLGGLTLYTWVFSSYLLTQTALTVVFGKLADIYGRKPVALFGIAVFLAGSILAGFATSMPALIVFRLIQGAGAGALQPASTTIIADLYPGRERGKIQGYLASVWAVSAIVGPLLGGLIVHSFAWSWIFWINVPIGCLAAGGFILFLHEQGQRRQVSVDVAGAILAAVAIASLMLLLTEASNFGLLFEGAIAAVLLVSVGLFVLQERRAPDPMISFSLWTHRPIAAANALTLVASMALMGLTTFVPMYVQGVLGQPALIAGFALTTMLIGWPIGATVAARTNHRFGPRPLMLTGSVLLPLGATILVLGGAGNSPLMPAAASLVMGFGMGLITVNSLLLIQGTVAAEERGSGTASNLFCRNLGSTLGSAVLGGILNVGLAWKSGGAGLTSEQLRGLLARSTAPAAGDAAVRVVLEGALHWTFIGVLAMAASTIFIAMLVPRLKPATPAPPAMDGAADLLPEG